MKIFYNFPYIKEILKYVLIPVVLVVFIVSIILFIYSKKHKDHENPHYNFVMDFWSSLIGIIITGAILAIAVAFSLAMTEKMVEYKLTEDKKMLYYLLKYFIIVPAVFVIWYIVKFLKTIYYKPHSNKVEEEAPNVDKIENVEKIPEPIEEKTSSFDEEIIKVEEEPKEVENINALEESLPPMEESLQEELDQFPSENEKKEEEEVEIISLEEDEENNE